MTTTALAVSTSASGAFTSTSSPSLTRQATSCASVRPSPRSGRRKVWSAIGERDVGRLEDSIDVGQVELLVARRWVGRVHCAHAGDGSLEEVEAVVGDARGDFAYEIGRASCRERV